MKTRCASVVSALLLAAGYMVSAGQETVASEMSPAELCSAARDALYGYPRDTRKAVELYRRAAEHGDAHAQFSLALRLLVDKNFEGFKWMRAAATQGHPGALEWIPYFNSLSSF